MHKASKVINAGGTMLLYLFIDHLFSQIKCVILKNDMEHLTKFAWFTWMIEFVYT